MNRTDLLGYKQIKIAYTKLIYEAKYRYFDNTKKFMDVISGLISRKEKELERYLGRFANVKS